MGISKRKPPVAVSVTASQGFTLVELLVVIAVIGILLALLLPAVQSARESGRKTACMSNAYQLGMAVNRYDQDKGKVPGWANSLGGRDVSWPVMSLPTLKEMICIVSGQTLLIQARPVAVLVSLGAHLHR